MSEENLNKQELPEKDLQNITGGAEDDPFDFPDILTCRVCGFRFGDTSSCPKCGWTLFT